MYKKENTKIISLYAISSVHAGSGASTDVVDLPIQRERHTNWPFIQASGVKGAMRDHFESFYEDAKNDSYEIAKEIFGSSKFSNTQETVAGSISVSDAKLLAFPMRSNFYPFVWITCPSVIKRLAKDYSLVSGEENSFTDTTFKNEAISLKGIDKDSEVLLEDMEVTVTEKNESLPKWIEPYIKKAERLLLVSDEIFNYAVTHCCEIQTQITIEDKTGTTVDGSLRYQELLPADSIMYVVFAWGSIRVNDEEKKVTDSSLEIIQSTLNNHIQIGGDLTLGKGLFELEWIPVDDDTAGITEGEK